MTMRCVGISESRKGEVLQRNIYDHLTERLFLARGHIVTRRDIEQSAGKMLIEVDAEERPESEELGEEAAITPINDSPFDTLELAMLVLGGLFKSIGSLQTNRHFVSKVTTIGMTLNTVCKIDEDLTLSTIIMEQSQAYPVVHSMQTAIVCEIVSKKLGWSPDKRSSLVSAALTMDIAMLSLQNMLHRQSAPLTDSQKDTIRAHPLMGAGMLRKMSVTDTVWLDTVLQHHESIDGTGYPYGLKGGDICKTARLLSLANVYCARVSSRHYRAPLSAVAVLKDIYLDRGHKVDTDMAMTLIKTMGLFPPGTFVKLKNGETAIVTHRGEKTHKPLVHTIIKADDSCPMSPLRRDTCIGEFSIVSDLPASKIRVNVNCHQLWGYGIFKKSHSIKRKHRRIKLKLPVKILELKPIRVTDANMINISQSGCLLKLPYQDTLHWELEKDYYLTFRLIDNTVENAVSKVRNIIVENEEQLLGIEFFNLDEELSKHIKHFISRSRGIRGLIVKPLE